MMLTLYNHILGYRDALISTKFTAEKIGQNNPQYSIHLRSKQYNIIIVVQ